MSSAGFFPRSLLQDIMDGADSGSPAPGQQKIWPHDYPPSLLDQIIHDGGLTWSPPPLAPYASPFPPDGGAYNGAGDRGAVHASAPHSSNGFSGTAWALGNLDKALDYGQAGRAAALAALKLGASPAEQRLFDEMAGNMTRRLSALGTALTLGSDAANAQAQVQAGADPAQAYAHGAGHSAAVIGSGIAGGALGTAFGGPPGGAIGAAIGSALPDTHIPDEVKALFPGLLLLGTIQSGADSIGQYLKNRGW